VKPQIDVDEWTDGGYPTDAALKRIEEWEPMDANACLDFVAAIWHWPDFGVSHELRPSESEIVHAEPHHRHLRLATGGWSGNESIVAAMKHNAVFRAFTWQLTAAGGLHIFRYMETR
jgi:hypothetical protein